MHDKGSTTPHVVEWVKTGYSGGIQYEFLLDFVWKLTCELSYLVRMFFQNYVSIAILVMNTPNILEKVITYSEMTVRYSWRQAPNPIRKLAIISAATGPTWKYIEASSKMAITTKKSISSVWDDPGFKHFVLIDTTYGGVQGLRNSWKAAIIPNDEQEIVATTKTIFRSVDPFLISGLKLRNSVVKNDFMWNSGKYKSTCLTFCI